MKKIHFCLALFIAVGAAHSAPTCNAPPEKWVPEADVKMALYKQGFSIKSFTVRNGCYCVVGLDASGTRFEIYLDPATGETIDE